MRLASGIIFLMLFAACVYSFKKTISGDGNVTTSERNISSVHRIKCSGNYDVQLTQGSPTSVKITADQNLQSYIVSDVNGDELNIHYQHDVNLDPTQKIKIDIVTDKLEGFELNGAGDVNTTNKFTGGDHLDLDIAGTGNIHFDVNTPAINSNISGSGDIYLSGETRDSKIEIAGNGNYHAEDLKSENVKVKVAGNGDTYVFADSTLDVNIAGVGNVHYKGNATITQSIAGAGKIRKIE